MTDTPVQMHATEYHPLSGVTVVEVEGCSEDYQVNHNGVTSIQWHQRHGSMAAYPTILVYVRGKLHSEHPFHNVLGVYYNEKDASHD